MKLSHCIFAFSLIPLVNGYCQSPNVDVPPSENVPPHFFVELVTNHHVLKTTWGEGRGVMLRYGAPHRVQFSYKDCRPFLASKRGSLGYRANPNGATSVEILTFPNGSNVPDHCTLTITKEM